MALLDTFWDPGTEVNAAESLEDIMAQEVERLQITCAVVLVTSQIPKRLSDATREELALDKKRARRILHSARQSLRAWGGEERAPTKDEQVTGAQMSWEVWVGEYETWLQARLRYVATWAKVTGNLRFGKSAIVKLSQELDWLRYAMRD